MTNCPYVLLETINFFCDNFRSLPVVGLTWGGMLCMTSTSQNSDGSYVSGTGVSSIVPNYEFQVVAHEIGHSFGKVFE